MSNMGATGEVVAAVVLPLPAELAEQLARTADRLGITRGRLGAQALAEVLGQPYIREKLIASVERIVGGVARRAPDLDQAVAAGGAGR